jgi:hypothetical protein
MTGHTTKMIRNSTAEFLIFTKTAEEDSIEIRYEDETLWLSQKMLTELFGVCHRRNKNPQMTISSTGLCAVNVRRKGLPCSHGNRNAPETMGD